MFLNTVATIHRVLVVKCLFLNRMESDDEDAPESIIPASSPESNVGEETPRFPHLREPKEEETERAISPIIPLIPRTAIPGTVHSTAILSNLPSYNELQGHISVLHFILPLIIPINNYIKAS